VESLATAAIISEDPHAVLVEFSSVVADTQEYIIKVRHVERKCCLSPDTTASMCIEGYMLSIGLGSFSSTSVNVVMFFLFKKKRSFN